MRFKTDERVLDQWGNGGTVLWTEEDFCWVLFDGSDRPNTMRQDDLSPEPAEDFEVGRSYESLDDNLSVYHIVAKLPNGAFVYWMVSSGQYSTGLAYSTQRKYVREVLNGTASETEVEVQDSRPQSIQSSW